MLIQRMMKCAALTIVLSAASEAHAHIEITSHTTRHGPDKQKRGPCGVEGSSRGETIYSYRHGETVTLEWYEFVDHPGHYRVAFDDAGDDDFADPISPDDRYTNATVLRDGIEDIPDVHTYEVDVELPDITCETCTIQIIQVMLDKPPYGDGNDLYYHCIDVRLVADGEPLPEPETGGCRIRGGANGFDGFDGFAVVGLGLVLASRRRRRSDAQ